MFRNIILQLLILPMQLISQHKLPTLYIISKPELSPSEIIAIRDPSGRFYAGIQVISDIEEFKYNSDKEIARLDDNPGKDMIYLSPEAQVLNVYHAEYEPLKIILSDLGIRLDPAKVWIIQIAGEIPLQIDSYPKGASVYIDSTYLGQTPFKGNFKVGIHTITLRKELYHDYTTSIGIPSTKPFVFEMMPKFGSLDVDSKPTSADVFLDGILSGKTRLVIDTVLSGEHQLTVRKYPLFRDERKTIIIVDGKKLMDNVFLNKKEEMLLYKKPAKAFVLSMLFPGLGQAYAKSSLIRISAFSGCSFFSWLFTVASYQSWKSAEENSDYLYSLDPTGNNVNYTIRDWGDQKMKTGSEWRKEENTMKKTTKILAMLSIGLNIWAAFDASSEAKSFNKNHGILISYKHETQSIQLVYSYTF